jgi:FtsP/CotA-like multicopper oxidase with cupredoxin domain
MRTLGAGLALALATAVVGYAGDAAPPPRPDLRDPPQVVSHDGLLRARLIVERRRVEVGGRKLWALTYNGRYMPPTLRFNPGDRMELALENRLTAFTNLHVHGLNVSPSGNADNIFLHIKPGQTYRFSYRFPKDLAPGTYWYHSHADPISAPQVGGGMSGVIVVNGLQRYLPPDLRGITEHVVALKDFQVQGDTVRTQGLKIGAPTNRTVDGQLNPAIRIRPGETQLWRLANVSANIYYRVHLDGERFTVIARDANPVPRTWTADSLLIPAGARFDVLVQGGPPGRTLLRTLPFDTGPGGNKFPEATLATVVSGGTPVHRAALPTTFAPGEDLSRAPIAARHTLVFSENKAGTAYFINGRRFDMNRVDLRSKLNTVEEWTVRNDSNEDHSFHVHVNDFQLMSVDGLPPPHPGDRMDTTNVPAHGQIVLKIRFAHFTGKTVLHCHILNHEDAGMMAVLEIVP